MPKKNYLIFLSDQHRGDLFHAAGNEIIRTPNLDDIAKNGARFESCYSACPLCVPSRVAMLSTQLAMHTQVYTNHGSIRDDAATFLHSLAAEGYETVLCGRMHFEGPNQRHGFTRRIAPDLLQLYPGQEDAYRELDYYRPTISENGCSKIYGGGDHSPVLDYDRMVIESALDYLSQEHDKPQCIVVGTYAPHFPFVGPPELYSYYLDRLVDSDKGDPQYDYVCSYHEPRFQHLERREVLRMRAAYYAMIENLDRQIGEVRRAWNSYCRRSGVEGVFIYTSDHGESLGERDLYAKKTLYDNAARVPLLIEGLSEKGIVIKEPVGLIDIGITIASNEDAMIPYNTDGRSFLQLLAGGDASGNVVFSECMELIDGQFYPGIMVRKGRYKLIKYYGFDDEKLLFDLVDDPQEVHNLSRKRPEIVTLLEKELDGLWNPEELIKLHKERTEHIKILIKWGKKVHPIEKERWHIPHSSLEMPKLV